MARGGESHDLHRLLDLVKSSDIRVSSDAFCALRDLVNTGDGFALELCFNDYVETLAEPVLDIITSVREPNDKVLLECASSVLKNHPYVVLDVLFSIIRKSPMWMQKLPNSAVFNNLLKALKQGCDVPFCIGALYVLSCLLPLLPSLSSHFSCLCAVFLSSARLVQKHLKTPYERYLRTAFVSFFTNLYGLYPCNVIAFLRLHFNGCSNGGQMALFSDVIRPILKTVSLHPLMLTSTKEAELAKERWVNKEPHDIFVECVDVTTEGLGSQPAEPVPPEATVVPTVFFNSVTSELSSYKTSPAKCDSFNDLPTNGSRCRRPTGKDESTVITPINEEPVNVECTVSSEDTVPEWFSPSEVIGLSTPPGSSPSTPVQSMLNVHHNEYGADSPSGRSDDGHTTLRRSKQRRSGELTFRRSFGSAISKLFGLPDSPVERHRRSTGTRSVPPSPSAKLLQRDFERSMEKGDPMTASMPICQQAEIAEEAREMPAESDPLTNIRRKPVAVNLLSRFNKEPSTVDSANASVRLRHSSSQSNCSLIISRRSSFIDRHAAVAAAWHTSDELIGVSEPIRYNPSLLCQDPPRRRAVTSSQWTRAVRPQTGATEFLPNRLRRSTRTRSHSCPSLHADMVQPGSQQRQQTADSTIRSEWHSRLVQTPSLFSYGSDWWYQQMDDDNHVSSATPFNDSVPECHQQLQVPDPAAEKYIELSKKLYDDLLQWQDARRKGKTMDGGVVGDDGEPLNDAHFLALKVAMLECQLEYEQHRRKMLAERCRRMHGRVRHVVSLEAQLQNGASQIRWLKYERQQIIDAQEKLNRENQALREALTAREKGWSARLEAVMKEKRKLKDDVAQCQLRLELQKQDSQRQREEASRTSSRLLDAECEVRQLTSRLKEVDAEHAELAASVQILRQHSYRMQNIQKENEELSFRVMLAKKCQEMAEGAKVRYEKENDRLRDAMHQSQVRTESAIRSAAQAEAKLCKKRALVDELRTALSKMQSLHQEQIEAVQMKYKALVAVCTRQEAHIMELYQQLEEIGTELRLGSHPTRSSTTGMLIPRRAEAPAAALLEDSLPGDPMIHSALDHPPCGSVDAE